MEKTEQDHRQFEEAAPIYATGGLEPQEREAFEAHLQTGCSVCFDLLKELQPTNEFKPEDPVLVHSDTLRKIPEHNPPSEEFPVQSSHSRVSRGRRASSRAGMWPKVRSVLTSGMLALLLVLVAAGSLWYAVTGQTDLSDLVEERQLLELDVHEINQRMERLQDQIKEQAHLVSEIRKLQEDRPVETGDTSGHSGDASTPLKALMGQLAAKERENASLRRQIAEMTEYEAFVQSSSLQVVRFVASKRSLDANAFLFYDPVTGNALFYGSGLPPVSRNAIYQIWALIKQPVRLGTFTPDPGKNGRVWLHNIVKLVPGTKFAVSVERDGSNAPKPAGEIYLLGEMKTDG